MKVISIKQPYASLIANGYKEYEFRTWKTKFRGEIYIHASLGIDKKAMEKYKDLNLIYPKGAIIAKVHITDCILINDEFRKILSKKNKYGIYDHIINSNEDDYAFKIEDVEKIDNIEAKGQLGIWNYNNDHMN